MNRRKISLYATMVMTSVLFFLIIGAVAFLPSIMRFYSEMRGGIDCTSLMVALYVSALPGFVCDLALMKLLRNIYTDKIFVSQNVTILKILSYCCIFVGIEYLIFAHRYITMILIAFVALFIGLILRVIKNVFDKAIEIRTENDYTI